MKANIGDVRILQILNWLIFDLNIFFSTDSYAFVRRSYLDLLSRSLGLCHYEH